MMRVVSNMPIYDRICKQMKRLNEFGENNIFISQHEDNEPIKATVVMRLITPKGTDAEIEEASYLQLRRMLTALQYRIEQDTEFSFDFKLKRKSGA